MCLAVPLKITQINGADAVGERDGIRRNIRVDFIREPKIGDYVMVHAGFAIERIRPEEAESDWEAAREVEAELAALYAEEGHG
ncbi:MAG: HypC/HybG/HupF family hydrogenase formation chaperone [Lachnospiraceae bacterium]|nr:HypC/HybG/HupF family hydrogenase formation chaperone [Lachnospiraceae bacterium]